MIGIGVGIDYALFIVTRYRSRAASDGFTGSRRLEAMTTSGRAVVFAGFTVMISVLGMFLMGLNFLQGLAVGTSLAVVVAVLAAITLLPALLGFVGFTIDRFHVGRWKRRKESCGTAGLAPCSAGRPHRDRRVRALVVAALPRSDCGSEAPTPATTRRRARRIWPMTSSPRGSGPAPTDRSLSLPTRRHRKQGLVPASRRGCGPLPT